MEAAANRPSRGTRVGFLNTRIFLFTVGRRARAPLYGKRRDPSMHCHYRLIGWIDLAVVMNRQFLRGVRDMTVESKIDTKVTSWLVKQIPVKRDGRGHAQEQDRDRQQVSGETAAGFGWRWI